MGFLDKPEWWGAPVLTKANIRRYRRTLLFVILASVFVGFLASVTLSDKNVASIEWFLRTSAITFALMSFIAAVFFSIFSFTGHSFITFEPLYPGGTHPAPDYLNGFSNRPAFGKRMNFPMKDSSIGALRLKALPGFLAL